MNRILKIFLAAAVLFFCTTDLYSQEAGRAEASLGNNEMLMGTLETLSISVPLPSDSARVEFPLLQEAPKDAKYVTLLNDTVELLLNHKQYLKQENGSPVMVYDLSIQVFDSGTYQLPPFEFLVGGQKVLTNPVELIVLPVKVKADDKIDDFSDIAEPFEPLPEDEAETQNVFGKFLPWWLIGAGIILVGLILYFFLRYRKTGTIFSLKPVAPSVKALNKLKKLQNQNLPERGRVKEYYTKLSDILRSYLHGQFGIKTLEKTTTEIMESVSNTSDLVGYEKLLKDIFDTSDFVKFAKINPSEVENRKYWTDAYNFVVSSSPQETGKSKEMKKGGKK